MSPFHSHRDVCSAGTTMGDFSPEMKHLTRPDNPLTEFISTYLGHIGLPVKKLEFQFIPGDGSKRHFWRIQPQGAQTSFMVMENSPTDVLFRRENLSYLMIGRHLFRKGLPVPQIHEVDLAKGWFLMEDMGASSLQETLTNEKGKMALYEKVTEVLFRLQIEGSRDFDRSWCYQTGRYDHAVMRRYESEYFKSAFLGQYLGLEGGWSELEGPFNHLAETASMADNRFFLHRDFQSRNIVVRRGRIGILDWQGGRLGPLAYDLASLIIDPYSALAPSERAHVYDSYLRLLGDYQPGWVGSFEKYFPYLAIQRNLQILGAFSYLTKVRKKPFFEAFIAPALKSLHGLLDELNDPKLSPLRDLPQSLPHPISG